MRGDIALSLRLLSRPAGLVGLVGVVGGVSAFAAAYLPWYEVAAEVDALGVARSTAVATLAGWQAHPWGWIVPALALAAIVVAGRLAVDRPVRSTRDTTLVAGLGLAAAVAAAGASFPPVSRFDVAGSRLRELADLSGRLPSDVELTFSVRPGPGLWLTLAAAALVIAVAFASREVA